MSDTNSQVTINDVTIDMFLFWFEAEVFPLITESGYKTTRKNTEYNAFFDLTNDSGNLRVVARQYRINSLDIFLYVSGELPRSAVAFTVWFLSERYHVSGEDFARIIDELMGVEHNPEQNELPLSPLDWSTKLREMGISLDTPEWWDKLDEWTHLHRKKFGQKSLPVSGGSAVTLEKVTGFGRKKIYDNMPMLVSSEKNRNTKKQ